MSHGRFQVHAGGHLHVAAASIVRTRELAQDALQGTSQAAAVSQVTRPQQRSIAALCILMQSDCCGRTLSLP